MKVLAIIGAPCAGKSVMAAKFYAYLMEKGYRVTLLHETVSTLIKRGKVRDGSDIDQERIIKSILLKLKQLEVTDKTDYVVCEDSVFNARLYNPDLHTDSEWKELLWRRPVMYMKMDYSEITKEMYDPSTRIHTYEQCVKLDKDIFNILVKYKLPYYQCKRYTPVCDVHASLDYSIDNYL